MTEINLPETVSRRAERPVALSPRWGGWNRWGGCERLSTDKKSDQLGAKCSSEMINDPIDEEGTPQQEELPRGSPPEMRCAHSFGCVPFLVFKTNTP